MAKELVFIPGMFVKEVRFKDGNPITKVSMNVGEIIPFLESMANEKGYVNIDIRQSKGGDKMYATLNDFVPQGQAESQGQGSEAF